VTPVSGGRRKKNNFKAIGGSLFCKNAKNRLHVLEKKFKFKKFDFQLKITETGDN
jgi:hypothetical protein